MTQANEPVHTCIGVGVGPANLSLACLLERAGVDATFLDAKPSFSWHDGMQIEDASLQVSLFKDLVTLHDPSNPYSFVNYLHQAGRLYHFLNARFESVSRREFADYMTWAADRNTLVRFGEPVEEIGFDGDFTVRTSKRLLRARSVSIGIGKTPKVPEQLADKLGDTIYHCNNHLTIGASLAGRRVVVVGGGQSGAEVVLDLLTRRGSQRPARTTWISSRECFWPIDDSPFTNDLFMPCQVALFASRQLADRADFVTRNILASDGISPETLKAIYQALYMRRFVDGESGFAALMPGRRLKTVGRDGGAWLAVTRHVETDETELVHADVIVLATGYRYPDLEMLSGLAPRLTWEGEEIALDDTYAARWDGPPDRHIFVQNRAMRQKGLADPNLSLLAWRSGQILSRLLGRPRGVAALPSMIDWRPQVPDAQLQSA
ncbi:SidA/IucD/PvdA family monooxygenase [Salinarimonas sp.]|uniref:lysine N(6)-hydroxylase/L-ornithine N(5)-oxygenase family protein n=1 Tax=Salinarimonas sp. TaxID=2766526 RepID=UPI0032D8FA53